MPSMTNSASQSSCVTRLVEDIDSFLTLAPEWNALTARRAEPGAWYQFDWYRCWWESFGKAADLKLICIYRDDNLTAVAPLILVRMRLKGFNFRVLKFIENGITPRSEFIGQALGADEVAAIWNAVLDFSSQWDFMLLSNVAHTGPTLKLLRDHVANNNIRHVELGDRSSPYIRLDIGWEGVRSGLGKRLKRNLSNARNRLERAGGFTVETCATPDEITRGLEQAIAISRKSWKGRLGKDMAGNRQRLEFYQQIARAYTDDGRVRIWLLRHRDQAIAFEYALIDRDHLLLLAIDYDQDFSVFSPGTLLRSLVLEQLVDSGLSCYDFSGTNYDYKLHWTRNVRPHSQFWIFHDGLKSRLLYFMKSRILPALENRRQAPKPTASDDGIVE